ncbi:MAG: formate--tetrahydrofolate ligase [Myxococcota bacterium]
MGYGARVLPIIEVASKLGVSADHVVPYGRDKAKIDLRARETARDGGDPARLILVSALTPTPAGEGKTTTTIGLSDALAKLGHRTCAALREPSLGPCFGIKGGGTGGGESRLAPSDDINLHFTGDFHAITAAHNLLSAAIDNHLHFGSDVDLESRKVTWPRVLDVNDRALRNVVVGLGGKTFGMPRQGAFDITAASEVMAMLCLADDAEDLRVRIDRTLVGFNRKGEPVSAGHIGATGAMLALLRDVVHPNLAQTNYGTPALVHGGPFANIAHGCNSVIATKTAMHLADWVVTEAGFGFDLGAEKFFDIKCRSAGLKTSAVVIVATVRALKMHGGKQLSELSEADPEAVGRGIANLAKHIESAKLLGQRPIVAVNRFTDDTDAEIAVVEGWCAEQSVPFAACEHFARGPDGALDLARKVVEVAQAGEPVGKTVYALDAAVPEKIEAVARGIYGAKGVAFTGAARKDLKQIEALGYGNLPICVAKTQSSLSDNPALRGRPTDFEITVRNVRINAGAGFLVVLTGDVLRMPGLPRKPQYANIDLVDGTITGLR